MLSIWPENQPMSRVADFACCAILDFRSPCGNDYDNQEMPSGMSTVALNATTDLSAQAGLSLQSLRLSGSGRAAIRNREDYLHGYHGQTDSQFHAKQGVGKAAGFGSGTNPPLQGKGFGYTANRPTGNR